MVHVNKIIKFFYIIPTYRNMLRVNNVVVEPLSYIYMLTVSNKGIKQDPSTSM